MDATYYKSKATVKAKIETLLIMEASDSMNVLTQLECGAKPGLEFPLCHHVCEFKTGRFTLQRQFRF